VLKTISGNSRSAERARSSFSAGRSSAWKADKIVRLGLSHVPEGREVFPFLSVRENLMMGAYPRSDRDGVAGDLERVYGYFPRLKERLEQPAGQLSAANSRCWRSGATLMMNRPTLPASGRTPRSACLRSW